MGILSRFNEDINQEMLISLIGPPNAGKTTFVRYLEKGEPVTEEISTTLGLEYRTTPRVIDNVWLKVIDVGGQEVFQQTFWEIAIEQADVVVFVIDATITKTRQPQLHELMVQQFDYALDIIPETKPLIFLLNKQDLIEFDPMDPKKAMKSFDKDKIADRSITFLPTSAKYGDGVLDAIELLVKHFKELKNY